MLFTLVRRRRRLHPRLRLAGAPPPARGSAGGRARATTARHAPSPSAGPRPKSRDGTGVRSTSGSSSRRTSSWSSARSRRSRSYVVRAGPPPRPARCPTRTSRGPDAADGQRPRRHRRLRQRAAASRRRRRARRWCWRAWRSCCSRASPTRTLYFCNADEVGQQASGCRATALPPAGHGRRRLAVAARGSAARLHGQLQRRHVPVALRAASPSGMFQEGIPAVVEGAGRDGVVRRRPHPREARPSEYRGREPRPGARRA